MTTTAPILGPGTYIPNPESLDHKNPQILDSQILIFDYSGAKINGLLQCNPVTSRWSVLVDKSSISDVPVRYALGDFIKTFVQVSYIPHPTPYTLHPTPYTLHPKAYIPHTTPYTLHPTHYALHPISQTPKLDPQRPILHRFFAGQVKVAAPYTPNQTLKPKFTFCRSRWPHPQP